MRAYLFLIFSLTSFAVQAQLDISTSISRSWANAQNIEGKLAGCWTLHFGVDHRFDWPSEKVHLQLGFDLNRKGYDQLINDEDYQWRFWYFGVMGGFSFEPLPVLSIQTGIRPAFLGDGIQRFRGERYKVSNDFRYFNLDYYTRVKFKPENSPGFFIDYQQSILPALDYRSITAEGNLSESFNDIYFRSFSAGIFFTIKSKSNTTYSY
ncbi:MAG: hypothetical protein AAGI07_09470 [Bacteroidota bacterium]